MNLTNRDKVERILNIVRDSLRSFIKPLIDDALKSKSLKHSDFQKVVNKRIGLKGYEVHKWDVTALFTFILDKDLRSIVFEGVFSDNQIEELNELRKMRNDWAHQESFSDDDLSLLLDLAHQLLIIIKAYEDAEKLKEITIEHEALEPVPLSPRAQMVLHWRRCGRVCRRQRSAPLLRCSLFCAAIRMASCFAARKKGANVYPQET